MPKSQSKLTISQVRAQAFLNRSCHVAHCCSVYWLLFSAIFVEINIIHSVATLSDTHFKLLNLKQPQIEEESWFKWLSTRHGCWCQKGWNEYFRNYRSTGILPHNHLWSLHKMAMKEKIFSEWQFSGWKYEVSGKRQECFKLIGR